ncbi:MULTISPECIES: TIGR02281 family clan AA aspartic protease [Agrobacterium]|uniref:TIGR02281 family clan AA aspartic protease n=1 Tax=Agrobacterium tumefaciens TaxID=358 RepID=A0AAJ4N095_AGRTU|nr:MULTISPECIES: TIGR02281 family clan AA aspartic protease [Agrobacterium]MEA1840356.1 TIGR02281 family clan AA aspartic protease [Agrobacterium tumefaciens]MRH97900.1 TIGR02281 family clan AA aspartic protease [Agrobacterium tumefaciens]NTA42396.1 TIGR02281 family clan AA aspartic protease [Agrobacterium tumefaciens]NTA58842.1 TIGR02281 family clan AA aspartic protease [Agrobacterium tumefaciens]QTG12668.1 TIGR02281 family clan AA aspartic protease [Agrobacterium tumefaciens]
MNRLTFVLLLLAVGLGLLLVNHDSGRTFGIDNEKFGQIVYLLPIAGLLSVGILAGSRGSFASVVRQLAIWLVIILGLVSVYLYRYDLQSFADRLLGGLMPGRAVVVTTAGGEQEIILHKSMSGHFEANVSIEGKTIHMLFDTGASSVVLANADAAAIGIDTTKLRYTVPVMTANGRTAAAPVTLSEIGIGPIARNNIPALVAQDGQLGQSLLGMSFLSTLGSMQMQTDELRLRDR